MSAPPGSITQGRPANNVLAEQQRLLNKAKAAQTGKNSNVTITGEPGSRGPLGSREGVKNGKLIITNKRGVTPRKYTLVIDPYSGYAKSVNISNDKAILNSISIQNVAKDKGAYTKFTSPTKELRSAASLTGGKRKTRRRNQRRLNKTRAKKQRR